VLFVVPRRNRTVVNHIQHLAAALVTSAIALMAAPTIALAQDASPDDATLVAPIDQQTGVAPQAQAPASPTVPWWIEHKRACDGCPWRRPGWALIQTTVVNGAYGLGNLARGQVTARITPETWWANMQSGWVWDLDEFVVNQFGHPYQGSNYYNSGRGNGLNFWEASAVAAFGSGTWEYFGETNKASLNDFINTTLGGIALGEVFHRAAWLVRDPGGSHRLRQEIFATVIDPITGYNRFASGDYSNTRGKPPDMVPTSLGGVVTAGALWQGGDSSEASTDVTPFVELDMRYGEPASGRSRTPYDAFFARMRFGGGFGISEAVVRGRLIGQPLAGGRLQLSVSQAYDFNKNGVYEFGAQSFETNLGTSLPLSSRMDLRLSGWGGLTVLAAIDSLPLVPHEEPVSDGESAGQGVSEGPRSFDYGPGTTFGGIATLRHDTRTVVQATFEGRHVFVVDGVRANHLLQRSRVIGILPLHGNFGIGASGEYFSRHTYYKDPAQTQKKFSYPQVSAFLAWGIS
jgi:hypothetical protein